MHSKLIQLMEWTRNKKKTTNNIHLLHDSVFDKFDAKSNVSFGLVGLCGKTKKKL